jgi:hypothetical protein
MLSFAGSFQGLVDVIASSAGTSICGQLPTESEANRTWQLPIHRPPLAPRAKARRKQAEAGEYHCQPENQYGQERPLDVGSGLFDDQPARFRNFSGRPESIGLKPLLGIILRGKN